MELYMQGFGLLGSLIPTFSSKAVELDKVLNNVKYVLKILEARQC